VSLLTDLLLDLIGSGVAPSSDRSIVATFSAEGLTAQEPCLFRNKLWRPIRRFSEATFRLPGVSSTLGRYLRRLSSSGRSISTCFSRPAHSSATAAILYGRRPSPPSRGGLLQTPIAFRSPIPEGTSGLCPSTVSIRKPRTNTETCVTQTPCIRGGESSCATP